VAGTLTHTARSCQIGHLALREDSALYSSLVTAAHKRFLLVEHGLGSVVLNLVLNGLIAFLLFRGAAGVPLWGQQSIAGDTIGTTFFLPLFTCLIVTHLSRWRVRAGNLTPIEGAPLGLRWLPERIVWRAVSLGAFTAGLVAPVTLAALTLLGVNELSLWGFVAFKALFAAALGAVLTPLIALWAISTP
jgi:hypothetical protein